MASFDRQRHDRFLGLFLAHTDALRGSVRSLAAGAGDGGPSVRRVSLLGFEGSVPWSRGPEGLVVELPGSWPSPLPVVIKIRP